MADPYGVEKRLAATIPIAVALTLAAFVLGGAQCHMADQAERTKRQAETQATLREVCGSGVSLQSDGARAITCARLAAP